MTFSCSTAPAGQGDGRSAVLPAAPGPAALGPAPARGGILLLMIVRQAAFCQDPVVVERVRHGADQGGWNPDVGVDGHQPQLGEVLEAGYDQPGYGVGHQFRCMPCTWTGRSRARC